MRVFTTTGKQQPTTRSVVGGLGWKRKNGFTAAPYGAGVESVSGFSHSPGLVAGSGSPRSAAEHLRGRKPCSRLRLRRNLVAAEE